MRRDGARTSSWRPKPCSLLGARDRPSSAGRRRQCGRWRWYATGARLLSTPRTSGIEIVTGPAGRRRAPRSSSRAITARPGPAPHTNLGGDAPSGAPSRRQASRMRRPTPCPLLRQPPAPRGSQRDLRCPPARHEARRTLTRYGHVIDELEDKPNVLRRRQSARRAVPSQFPGRRQRRHADRSDESPDLANHGGTRADGMFPNPWIRLHLACSQRGAIVTSAEGSDDSSHVPPWLTGKLPAKRKGFQNHWRCPRRLSGRRPRRG